MAALPHQKTEPLYTVEEYLAFEREAEERHEYIDGVIYAMAGESPEQVDIATNLIGELRTLLRDTPCRVRAKDAKVLSGSPLLAQLRRSRKGLFSYPDVIVVCGEPQYLDTQRDVLLNPQVIIEILSESTEAKDRGAKFIRYRQHLPSLTDYILVSQHAPLIEHFIRQTDGDWLSRTVQGLEASLTIASLGCTISLAEIYRLVNFPPEEAELPDEEVND
ncbi:MAG TPA: Uma2 family endonuclease [Blastocatellia bacterium]|nr:Uma2 family endonuclease [Blastocatellia bacterium]